MSKNRHLAGKAAVDAIRYGKEGGYWLKKFSGDLKKTGFPYDYTDSHRQPLKQVKDTVKFQMPPQMVSKLTELSKGLEHRLYMILTASLLTLLYQYTGENDMIIGTPIFQQE